MVTKSGKALKFPKWVPMPAQQKLRELMLTPNLADKYRELLGRLATREEMKTDVWGKLPSERAGKEHLAIEWVWYAFVSFSTDVSPSNKKSASIADWKNWDALAREHPTFTTPASIANAALLMLSYMKDLEAYAAPRFKPIVPGVESYDDAIFVIANLGVFFGQLETDRKNFLQELPAAGSRHSEKAHRAFFTRVMSQYFTKVYGQPLDAVVSGLEQVAFNLSEGAGDEVVRTRRRTAKRRPEKIRPKVP